MANDARGISKGNGWMLNYADQLMAAVEHECPIVPGTTGATQTIGIFVAPAAVTITKLAYQPAGAHIIGSVAVTNAGTGGTLTGTIATLPVAAAGTVAANARTTLTLGTTRTTLNLTTGQGLNLVRGTTGGDSALPSAMVYIEYNLSNTTI